MIHDLIRDVIWAKARVLILGGWKSRRAWRFMRMCARHEGVPIPSDVYRVVSGGRLYG